MMKSFLAAVLLVLSALTSHAGMEKAFPGGDSGFELKGAIGYAGVEAVELVYYDGYKLSQLNWDSTVLLGSISAGWSKGKLSVAADYTLRVRFSQVCYPSIRSRVRPHIPYVSPSVH